VDSLFWCVLRILIVIVIDKECKADAILNSDIGIHLRGVAIGNGWIDARRQYASYIDFAVKVGILEENSDVRATSSMFFFSSFSHNYRHGNVRKCAQTNAWRT
jgi:hypothetical protein